MPLFPAATTGDRATAVAAGSDGAAVARTVGTSARTRVRRAAQTVLVAALLDRITRETHTLSQMLEDGYSIRVADKPCADDLMMRNYTALTQALTLRGVTPRQGSSVWTHPTGIWLLRQTNESRAAT
jgi:hypothetical protein